MHVLTLSLLFCVCRLALKAYLLQMKARSSLADHRRRENYVPLCFVKDVFKLRNKTDRSCRVVYFIRYKNNCDQFV